MRIQKFEKGGRHIHLELEQGDHIKSCPFCGGVDDLELANTHTACYWVKCPCGAEVTGKAYGRNTPSSELTMRQHKAAKASTLERWNRRSL